MKEIRLRVVSFLPLREVVVITSIIILALLLRMTLILTQPFTSDESIYIYASYAISQGAIPYREIELAHPPFMYLIYSMSIRLVGPNLVYLRLFAICINLITIPLTYFMAKILLKSGKLGLICAGIYALYPALIGSFYQIESILSLFALLSVIAYLKSHSFKRKTLLFLAGIFMGCALVTKLSAIFFISALLLFRLICAIWHKEYKSIFTDVPITLLGVAIPPALTLVWITFCCNALQQFYLHVYYWQAIRHSMAASKRLWYISSYFTCFLPLIVTGVLGVLYSIRRAKEKGNSLLLLPAWIYVFNVFIFIFVTKNTFFHYFFYLTPYLVLLSLTCFHQIGSLLFGTGKRKISGELSFTALLVFSMLLLLTILQVVGSGYLSTTQPFFNEHPYTKMESYAGNHVATISNPSDKIWTSEGSIAFFARRVIVAPNSTDWPFQGFFADVFGYDWDTYKGIKDHEQGVVSINQFIEAWEKERVKVIIFIRDVSLVAYPDQLLWDGFQDQEGVASYVQEKYELATVITSSEVEPYTFEIWVRK